MGLENLCAGEGRRVQEEMMLLQNCSFSGVSISGGHSRGWMETTATRGCKITSGGVHNLFFRRNTNSKTAGIRCFSFNTNIQIVDLLQNKVLVTAAASAAIGQLLKPFTSLLLHSKSRLDLKAALRAGGFPSTHSSTAVATATTLGFERGLSDPIFGLAIVYACLIMYDAQGVRREVGNHAKAINRAFSRYKLEQISSIDDANDFTDSFLGKSSNSESRKPLLLEELKATRLLPPNTSPSLKPDDRTESTTWKNTPVPGVTSKSGRDFLHAHLKESVGHTEIEVVAGALLGFFVSLAVCASSI